MRRLAHLVALAGWLAALALIAHWAWLLDTGPVAIEQPESVVAVGLRAVVLGTACWLAAGTVLLAASSLLGHDGAVRALTAVTPRFVARLARGVAAASVSTALLAGVTVSAVSAQDPAPVTQLQATLSLVDPGPASALEATLTLLVPDGRADRPEELGPIRRPAAVSPSPTVPPPAEVAPTATTAASPSSPAPVEREWVVQPGESFWSKAEEMRGGVSEAAVIGYWLDLIDANRDRLVRPGDPDLILPGQVFTLPPMEP